MCYNPIEILTPFKQIKNTYYVKKVSCRKCIECLQVRANEWGVRCHFELLKHKQNCFITLTYNDENNPTVLDKQEMQRFLKRLRKKIAPKKIKYFSCGEYGDQKLRPHYHIIIFGYDFQDKQYHGLSPSGKAMFTSEQLRELWPHGNNIVQEANMRTVQYSAKYSTKQKKDLPYPLSEFPEYNTMSQNLGIESALEKIHTYMKTDEIYIDGFKYIIPRIIIERYMQRLFKEPVLSGKKSKIGLPILYDWKDAVQDWIDFTRKEWKDWYFKDIVTYTDKELADRKRIKEKKKLHSKLRTI